MNAAISSRKPATDNRKLLCSGALFLLVFVAAAMARDRVAVTRDEKSITLSNQYLQVVVNRTGRMGVRRMDWIDRRGRKVALLGQGAWYSGSAMLVSPTRRPVLFTQTVIRQGDGSVTVAMLQWPGGDNRVTTYLKIRPGVAAVTWGGRVENLSDHATRAKLGWRFRQPKGEGVERLSGDVAGWYLQSPDINVLFVADGRGLDVSAGGRGRDWNIGASGVDLPAYSAYAAEVTIGVASGIGPACAASDAVTISKAKDEKGRWMVAVAPFGQLLNAEITVTAGLKIYRQTVNVEPREPFVVDTPLTEEKVAVGLRSARGREVLRSPVLKAKNGRTKEDVRTVSHQRVGQLNDALQAMKEGRWAEVLALSRKNKGDVLWVKLLGALAERGAGHKDHAEKMLRRIVSQDPAAAAAWWLLGDEAHAKALGDTTRVRRTIAALRGGRLPGKD